jgi:hypothetical protein
MRFKISRENHALCTCCTTSRRMGAVRTAGRVREDVLAVQPRDDKSIENKKTLIREGMFTAGAINGDSRAAENSKVNTETTS